MQEGKGGFTTEEVKWFFSRPHGWCVIDLVELRSFALGPLTLSLGKYAEYDKTDGMAQDHFVCTL